MKRPNSRSKDKMARYSIKTVKSLNFFLLLIISIVIESNCSDKIVEIKNRQQANELCDHHFTVNFNQI